MQPLIDAITELYKNWSGSEPARLDVLPQSGSDRRDRKSTRLNSSHVANSYALLCTHYTSPLLLPYTTLFRSLFAVSPYYEELKLLCRCSCSGSVAFIKFVRCSH